MSDTPVASSSPAESSPEVKSEEKKGEAGAEASAATVEAGKDEKKEEKKEEPVVEVKKMQAVLSNAYGESDKVLDFGEYPEPTITKPDQVLIKVHAAAINPVDAHIIHGHFRAFLTKHFPYVPGFDVAGEVIAVGAGVKRLAVGDRVFGDIGARNPQGSFAEYLVAPQHVLAKIPAGLTYSQAAAVPLVGLTAYQSLFVHGKITEKSQVLVLGGASGTGSIAVQFAKAIGAHVFSTASTRNFDFVRGLGADRVVDYSKEKWWDALKSEKIDVVFDTVGEVGSWEHAKPLLSKHGVFTQITRKEGVYNMGHFAAVLGRKIASWFGEPHYKYFLTDVEKGGAQLETISKWIEAGKVKPVLDSFFPFSKDGAVALFKAIEAGKARGKLVMEIIKPESPSQSNVEQFIAAAPPLPAPTAESSSSSAAAGVAPPATAATADAAGETPAASL